MNLQNLFNLPSEEKLSLLGIAKERPALLVPLFIMSLACYSIPLALLYYISKKDQLSFKRSYLLLSLFLLLTATYFLLTFLDHYYEISYSLEIILLASALFAVLSAFSTWKWLPLALSTPSVKELQRQSERQHKFLDGILRTTVDAFLTIDSQGIIGSSNEAASKLFGYNHQELDGKSIRSLMPADCDLCQSPGFEDNLKEALSFFKGATTELTCCTQEGKEFPAEVTLSEIQLDELTYYSVMVRNISDRKAHERQLNEAVERAHDATMAKSSFLANMSHELRTPLNSVIGMAEVINETPLNKEQQHYVNILLKSGRNLLSIINDILDLSKIEANQLKLEIIDFSIEDLIQEVVDLLAMRAHEKGIDLNYYVEPELLGSYQGDPSRIKQVLLNLISNAIKFTREGEVNIWVKASPDSLRPIQFSVEDTGIGINSSKLNQIFEDFNQLDCSITREFGGTGLGLSISKKLVSLMEGEISVSSQEHRGSIFSFNAKLKALTKKESLLPTLNFNERAKVIIFETRPSARKILSRHLRRLKAPILFANDSELKAMVMSKTYWAADTFLISIGHEIDNNLRLVNDLIDLGLAPSQLVVALNTDALSYCQIKAHSLGVDSFLTRPYGVSELYQTINTHEHAGSNVELDRRKRLLIIDDDADVLSTIKDSVLDLGVQITTADDPQKALRLIEQNKYDLILCDYKMPYLNGVEVHEQLKQWHPESQFILITGAEPDFASTDGATFPILKKPFTHSELAGVINQALYGISGPKPDRSLISSNLAPKYRILIVDDSEENRELMLAHLKQLPYKIDFAENGDVAVQMVKNQDYHLIFMDIQMPILDGYQATRIIRDFEQNNHIKHIPIVALTANALDPAKELQKSLAAGCDDHLTKPILKNLLFSTIEHHLGGHNESFH